MSKNILIGVCMEFGMSLCPDKKIIIQDYYYGFAVYVSIDDAINIVENNQSFVFDGTNHNQQWFNKEALDGLMTVKEWSSNDNFNNIFEFERRSREHVELINRDLRGTIEILKSRSVNHDKSKWSDSERPLYIKATEFFKSSEYQDDNYKKGVATLGTALDHHYANNSHHPEHYQNGVNGMSLVDLIEMLADWEASNHQNDGDFSKSFDALCEKFNICEQLKSVLLNSLREKRKDEFLRSIGEGDDPPKFEWIKQTE